MICVVFNNWLAGMNEQIRMRGREVVLTMDNLSTHGIEGVDEEVVEGYKVHRLSNVIVVKLPQNTTSEIRPMDQGIIRRFKARYQDRC